MQMLFQLLEDIVQGSVKIDDVMTWKRSQR